MRAPAKPRSKTAPGARCCCRGSLAASSSNSSPLIASSSRSIMEDDAERLAMAATHAADAVPHIDAIDAARALHRTVLDGENHGVALAQRYDFRPRLHARPLFGQHELAAGEIAAPDPIAGSSPAAETRARRRGPGAGSCSRRRRSEASAASAWSAPRHGSARRTPNVRADSARRCRARRSSGWRSQQGAGRGNVRKSATSGGSG